MENKVKTLEQLVEEIRIAATEEDHVWKVEPIIQDLLSSTTKVRVGDRVLHDMNEMREALQ